MSLNKTLDRFFDEIRREAKRNPDFADRLDAVLRGHGSRRDVPDGVLDDVAEETPLARVEETTAKRAEAPVASPPSVTSVESASASGTTSAFNPVAVFKRDGEAALATALESQGLPALQALVEEHNLDPSGETGDMDRDALAAHVLAYAKRRAARDEKLFDY